MKTNKLEKELKSLKNLPVDHNFLASNKEQLLKTIYNDPLVKVKKEISKTKHASFGMQIFSLKAVPAFLIIIALLHSTGTAYASQDSLPNDTLYPVKLLTERAEQVFTFDKVKKAEVAFKHAQKRIDELKRTKPELLKDPKILNRALENYEDKINLGIKYIKRMNDVETTLVPINRYDRELTDSRKSIKELSEKTNYQEVNLYRDAASDIKDTQSEFVKAILDKAKDTSSLLPALEEIANDRIQVWENEVKELPAKTIIIEPNKINLKEDAEEKIIIFKERIINEVETILPILEKELNTWSNNVDKIPTHAYTESIKPTKTNTFTSDEVIIKSDPVIETGNVEDIDKPRQKANSADITPEQQAFKDEVLDLIKKGDTSGALDLINSNPGMGDEKPSELNNIQF